MKRFHWQVELGLVLVVVSALFYLGHYFLFHDAHHIWIFLVGDIAFVPIEVLLVTLIIHRMLNAREKRAMLHKMNMVIGTFFSEVGNELIRRMSAFDPGADRLRDILQEGADVTDSDLARVRDLLEEAELFINSRRGDRIALRSFLLEKRGFLLLLLENPNVLEHDEFTDLLWAVFHLAEELSAREDVGDLPEKDLDHLSGDMERVYRRIVLRWISYMLHLKENYPYLFSLALRMNPFDPDATPVLR